MKSERRDEATRRQPGGNAPDWPGSDPRYPRRQSSRLNVSQSRHCHPREAAPAPPAALSVLVRLLAEQAAREAVDSTDTAGLSPARPNPEKE